MATPSSSGRAAALRDVVARTPLAPKSPYPAPVSAQFGINTFGARQMREKLPPAVYEKLADSIRFGNKLDIEIAPLVAQAIKDWALSRGVTHFTHWFQPQTGLTAEKHDAFLAFNGHGEPMESFTGAQLIQSEPDASSFPSGGLRATWEARGYTAWNPASPVFIVESGGVRTLCIPSVFIGYNGEALDEMTPLLRSSDVLSARAVELLTLLGETGVQRVYTTLGPEQEYFLIDRGYFALRPDLVMSGRTLLGAAPPRGQQLEDHYFGGIPERMQACIAEVEHELYKLGVPIITRHNEVAPQQFEMAPMFEETDIAVDHNQLVMATLRKVALRHGLHALLHEKPFAGINGSGKHCNWSMGITSDRAELDGVNLLKPGNTPHQNLRFLLFLAAVLQGVHRHAGLLRAGIASSGNEHRLGANEAPPAIISVFMGRTLTQVIDSIASGKAIGNAEHAMIRLGVAKLPDIEKDNTDRNRTSPFAFTGNKFEFRAVGASASIAFPVCLLNSAVAESIEELTEALRAERKKTKHVGDAVLKVVRPVFRATRNIRFEGNNYSDAWVKDAARRGLPNLRRTPEALAQLSTARSRKLLTTLGVFTQKELNSRIHVRLERYVKDMLIEAHTTRELLDTMVLPAGHRYAAVLARAAADAKAAGAGSAEQVSALKELNTHVATVRQKRNALDKTIGKAESMHATPAEQATYCTETIAQALLAAREASDALESAVDDQFWPLPKYREMLFPV